MTSNPYPHQPPRRPVAPRAPGRSWLLWLLTAVSVLACCGGLNHWILTTHTESDRAIVGSVVGNLVAGREYAIYADAPGVDEVTCAIGDSQFERELTIRRSSDSPLFASTASADGTPELPFFGWLRSDRTEAALVDCGDSLGEFLLVDSRGPLLVTLASVAVAVVLAVVALIGAVVRLRRPPAPGRRPSWRWLLAAPVLIIVGMSGFAVTAIGLGPSVPLDERGPEVGSEPVHGSVSVLTNRGVRYLVYQAGDGPAENCVPVLTGDRPLWVPETITHVGTEFRYVGSFRGIGHQNVTFDCDGDAPLMVRPDRGPLAAVSLAGSACLLLGLTAVAIALTVLVRRARQPRPGPGTKNARPVTAGRS